MSGAIARVAVWWDAAMAAHEPPEGHPERPERLHAAREGLLGHPAVAWRTPQEASLAELCAVHDPAYVEAILGLEGKFAAIDPDTYTSPGSIRAARLAAGTAVQAVDALLDGTVSRAFGLVRPPGHHASRAKAMGFCLFNNVAVAVARALERGLTRIVVIDFDVHHGNGTQALFEDRPEVLFYSSHQGQGFWPGTGRAAERGSHDNIVNVPLPEGAGHDALLEAFDRHFEARAEAFRPELVVVSAGFDAHGEDPVGGLAATDDTFAALVSRARKLADATAGGRILLMLEGGYNLDVLARCSRRCVDALVA